MCPPIELQPAVSRFESVRVRLSNLSWALGIGNFFSQNIPFSYSSGRILGDRLAKMMIPFLEEQAPPYHVYELGAGLGWLSTHVLDSLLTLRPDLYAHIQVHVTEVSQLMIEQLQRFSPHTRHPGKVSLEVMDGSNPHFEHPPHFVYASYLWDSLPCRHVSITPEGAFEIKVQTFFNLDRIGDATVHPPAWRTAEDIRELLGQPDSEHLRHLTPKILAGIQERYHPVPIEDCGWTEEEYATFSAFKEALGPIQTTFNFSIQAAQGLHKILAQLPKKSCFLFFDFGYTDTEVGSPLSPPMSPYNAYVCFGQYFPLYEWLSLQKEATYCLTQMPQGRTQAMLIHRSILDVTTLFSDTFPNLGIEKVEQAEARIHQASDTEFVPLRDLCLSSLSHLQKEDYSFLIFLASEHIRRNRLTEAKHFLNQAVSLFAPFCLSAYFLLGRIALLKKKTDLAESYFKQPLEVCPEYKFSIFHLRHLDEQLKKESLCFLSDGELIEQGLLTQ